MLEILATKLRSGIAAASQSALEDFKKSPTKFSNTSGIEKAGMTWMARNRSKKVFVPTDKEGGFTLVDVKDLRLVH